MSSYYIVGVVLLAWIVFFIIRKYRSKPKVNDSKLKQRAIFTANEQRTFMRLSQTLPDYIILAHVSFDSLLTTKFSHTRSKYRNMHADFAILSDEGDVRAIIMLDDYPGHKRDLMYKEEILKSAGYRVYHFYGVPNPQQILEALQLEIEGVMDAEKLIDKKKLNFV